MNGLPTPPRRRVSWRKAFRIIPARYPPIALFERIADPADWEALLDIESLTNDRIRDEVGDIRLVPPEDRVAGPGASWVMAAFTHAGRASRFSDGSYGVYYAARPRPCAVAETAFHYGRFFTATEEPPCELDVRVLVGAIRGMLHDIRGARRRYGAVYDPDDYRRSQAFAGRLRDEGSNGLVYDSVRRRPGECIAAFRPRVVSPPDGSRHLMYHFDGHRIDRYFDYARDRWLQP